MNEENARRIATLMVEKMSEQIPSEYKTIGTLPPKSLKDIIQIGLMVAHGIQQVAPAVEGAFPIEPELLAALACVHINPKLLTDIFTRALEASDEDPLELEATFLNVVVPRSQLTNLMAAKAEEFKAAGKQQLHEDRQVMFERWQALQPPLAALLELQQKHPKTDMAEALRFLAPEFPGLTIHVEVNLPTLAVFVSNSPDYGKTKQIKTKAQRLAAAIVAKEFGMADTYCWQLLTESRRAIEGRQRRRNP